MPAGFMVRAKKVLQRVGKVTGKKFGEVSLVIVKPNRIRQLNAVYRHKDKVTDVLSFIYRKQAPVTGEIVICLAQAKAQSGDWGSSLSDELDFLLVHGSLHLLGYDHMKIKDEKNMSAMANRILGKSRLGEKLYDRK